MTRVCGRVLIQLRFIASTCSSTLGSELSLAHIATQDTVATHTIMPKISRTGRVTARDSCRDTAHLLASFLTEILIVPFHQFALHIQVQRLLKSLLAPHVQTQLYPEHEIVRCSCITQVLHMRMVACEQLYCLQMTANTFGQSNIARPLQDGMFAGWVVSVPGRTPLLSHCDAAGPYR